MSIVFQHQQYPTSSTGSGRKRQLSTEATQFNGGYNNALGPGANNRGEGAPHPHKRTQIDYELPLSGIPSQPAVPPYCVTSFGDARTNGIQHVEFGNFGTNLGIQISNTTNYTGNVLWESLPRQRDTSGHRSDYLRGSRDEEVRKIRSWVETPSSELTLWICGPVGIGKSTLAREVARDLRMAGLLGAFVPLGSLPNDGRGPESVIKTIAREIGETHRDAIPAITEAISACKGTGVEDHLWNFIGRPVQTLQRYFPIVVVLDAFDEWEFTDVFVKGLDCLAVLSSVVRFILLGRSDPKSLGHENPFTRAYPLQPVSKAVMEEYFAREFEGVKWDHGRKPSTRDVSRLAEQADGLFIWASIACFLMGKGLGMTSPNETLEGILYSREKVGENGHLATLYGGVLQWLFPAEEEQAALRQYLGMILILQEPLLLDDFSFFSGIPSRAVNNIQTRLGALQIRNTTDDRPMVRPATSSFHLSFVEYLQRVSTPSKPTSFAAPSDCAHSDLAKACLQVLAAPLPAFQGLSKRQWYAAKHWVSHVSKSAPAVKPGSSSDWEGTEICSVLKGISTKTWRWWRDVILGLFIPGHVMGEASSGGGASDFLRDVAGRLEEQNTAAIVFRIACLSVVTRLEPDGVNHWAQLGEAYLKFAEVSSRNNLLHQAVAAYENAVTIIATKGISNPAVIGGLGMALERRFRRLRVLLDVDQSISLFQDALALCPSGHPDHLLSLNNLARSLWSRFEATNTFRDLQEALSLQQEALALCTSGHPGHSSCLHNLGNCLYSRFRVTNSFDDLHAAITLEKEALALRPSGHPDRSMTLYNLGVSLSSRFKVTNSFDDLQEAITLHKEALSLSPFGHPDRPSSLGNLAISLSSRFDVKNSFDDLQEAITLEKEALALRPSGHPDRSLTLYNLGISLFSRFNTTNLFEDLQEAIALFREALVLRPPGHVDRQMSLGNLAAALESRFRETGSVEDMDEASTLRQELDSSSIQ